MNDHESKRLFLALKPSLEDLKPLTATVKKLSINAEKKKMEYRFVPSKNYHITLSFLGDTPVDRLSEVQQIAKDIARSHEALKLEIKGLGGFSDLKVCRVLYAGVQKKRELVSLEAELTEALTKAGLCQNQHDEFTPHLTIARTRKQRDLTDLASPFIRTSFAKVSFTHLTLFESLMHGAHPHYEPLESWELLPSAP